MDIEIEHVAFPTRSARSEFVARRFEPYFGESLLDVGCYEAPLRQMLPGIEYTGVDFVGNPDIELNLEECGQLPFDDDSHDCVICVDVLEHLENFHAIFNELIRVARKHVIISLPNSWRDARRPIERGRGDFVHYGLPLEKPQDRHKWFFNFTQAQEFLEAQAARHRIEIVDMFGTEKPKNAPARLARGLRYRGESYLNRYVQTIWAVYGKGR